MERPLGAEAERDVQMLYLSESTSLYLALAYSF